MAYTEDRMNSVTVPEIGDVMALGVEEGAVTIVPDDDDDGEVKGVPPIGVGRDGEGVTCFNDELEDSALGVGEDGIFCCEDGDLRKVMT